MTAPAPHDDWKPIAQRDRYTVKHQGDEVLVYDRRADRAHTLSANAAVLWEAADGTRTIADLSVVLIDAGADPELAEALVEVAIDDLRASGLVKPAPAGREGLSRRELLARIGVAGGVVAAIPAVGAISTPAAAAGVDVRRILESLLAALGFTRTDRADPTPDPDPQADVVEDEQADEDPQAHLLEDHGADAHAGGSGDAPQDTWPLTLRIAPVVGTRRGLGF